MIIKSGIAVSPGIAIGPAILFGIRSFRIPQRFVPVDAVDGEVSRLRQAIQTVARSIEQNQESASRQLGSEYAAIFGAHLMMVQDPKLFGEIEALIRSKCFSPEFACSRVFRNYARSLQNVGNAYMAERAADVLDLEKRVINALLGEDRRDLSHLSHPAVILAHNLTPSETASLDRKNVLGFATEGGGRTSHTAILAGALELPAVVGVGSFLSDVSLDDIVIIDGNHGKVVIAPDEPTLAAYRSTLSQQQSELDRLASLKTVAAETLDGVRIQVMGNIEFPQEVQHCMDRGADGIGLYRTEFLYIGADHSPSEEEQYDSYKAVVGACEDRPVVIRTLDLGADKIPSADSIFHTAAENPALGLRSIRLSLRYLTLFKTQLRAILRAAKFGAVRIMFPLITSLLELRQAKLILRDVMDDLADEGVEFSRDVQVGMMVEVPAAALQARSFAREVDFFSIGTNDLIQYSLAVDRSDPNVAALYSAADPAILTLIKMTADAAKEQQIPVTICGQMSSDLRFIPLLIGLGVRTLSVTPFAIAEVRDLIRHLTLTQAEEIAEHALTLDLARDVDNYLRGELLRIYPEKQ